MAMIKTPTQSKNRQTQLPPKYAYCEYKVLHTFICPNTTHLYRHIFIQTNNTVPERAQSNKKATTWGIFFFFILSALNIHTNQYEKRDKHSKIKKKNWAAKFLVLHEWCTSGFHRYCCFLFSIFVFTHSKVLHVYNFLALYKYLQTSLVSHKNIFI